MKPISPPAVQHMGRSLRSARAKPKRAPNPIKWLKRQSWRFLIAYFLLRTAADLSPWMMSYATDKLKTEAQNQAIERLNPFKP